MLNQALGTHIILDLYGCNSNLLMHVEDVQSIMREATKRAKFTVVTEEYHQFKPHGVSGATIIQESNCCFHSWPELRYASIDIYYCGTNDNVQDGIDYLVEIFEPQYIERQDLARGIPRIYNKYLK